MSTVELKAKKREARGSAAIGRLRRAGIVPAVVYCKEDPSVALEIAARDLPTTVIVMSAYGTVETAVEAMRAGAYDYIMKPFRSDEVILTLRKAEEREQLRRENREQQQTIEILKKATAFFVKENDR